MKILIVTYFIVVTSFFVYDVSNCVETIDVNNNVEFVLDEEGYIDDIPFNTKRIVESLKK